MDVSPRGYVLGGAPERNGPESYKVYVPPRDVTGEVFGLNDAAVLTSAIAGTVPAVFAGAAAPADLARTGVPAVAGMEFPAVAEDLSLADDAGGLPLVIRVSEPLRAAAEADPLIDVGKASSVDLRRPTGLSGSDALRSSEVSRCKTPGSPEIWRMIGWAEETAWISHPTSIPRDMSHHRIVERRLWSGPLARRLRGS